MYDPGPGPPSTASAFRGETGITTPRRSSVDASTMYSPGPGVPATTHKMEERGGSGLERAQKQNQSQNEQQSQTHSHWSTVPTRADGRGSARGITAPAVDSIEPPTSYSPGPGTLALVAMWL